MRKIPYVEILGIQDVREDTENNLKDAERL
jgi:hypothetical protein